MYVVYVIVIICVCQCDSIMNLDDDDDNDADKRYVVVLALDFFKAFDTVRHATLLQKIAQLDLPDPVYNWLANFFSERSHCVRYGGEVSTILDINASIIQGSALGPVSYVVTVGDLTTVTPGNQIHKYADDTYILVPASNIHSRKTEVDHVADWAQTNNLKLNREKSVEIVFTGKRKHLDCNPPELPGISRVTVDHHTWCHCQ